MHAFKQCTVHKKKKKFKKRKKKKEKKEKERKRKKKGSTKKKRREKQRKERKGKDERSRMCCPWGKVEGKYSNIQPNRDYSYVLKYILLTRIMYMYSTVLVPRPPFNYMGTRTLHTSTLHTGPIPTRER